MPNLWDKTLAAPSSELNPLTNPVLEQNLGRWAKVYFSTPPAQRERAVSDLLEEIKRESSVSGDARSVRPYFATDAKFQRPACSACQHQNPPGHKFCSRCGQALSPGQHGSTERTVAPAASDAPRPNSPPSVANDRQWVREPAFSGVDDSYARPGRGWKYLVGASLIVLASFAYFRWVPGFQTRVASSKAPPQSSPATTFPMANPAPGETQNQTNQNQANQIPADKSPPTPIAPVPMHVPVKIASVSVASNARAAQSPSALTHDRAVVRAGIQSASQKSPLLDSSTSRQTFASPESGAPDLHLAQRYLEGSMGVRDSSEAAKLLWKAVRKENATAAILLSDLYLRGDGVPRSCDQARLLLIAAAKRGSPQAAQQLRNMESQGCQ